jgi:hypothetical protein
MTTLQTHSERVTVAGDEGIAVGAGSMMSADGIGMASMIVIQMVACYLLWR